MVPATTGFGEGKPSPKLYVGDQTEHALRDARRDGDEVRVRERRKRREPVQPPGDGLNDAGVTHGVERLAVDAEAQRFGHAEAAAMPAKQLDLALEGSGAHGTYCLQTS